MAQDLWSVLMHLEEIVRINECDIKPGTYRYLLETIIRHRDAELSSDGHLSSPDGCLPDCPACKEV